MAYDNLSVVSHTFAAKAMATNSTEKLKIPRGATMALVLDILVSASTTFTQVTSPATIAVGDGTNASIFGSLTIGALAAGSTLGAGDQTNGLNGAVYLAGNYNSGDGLHDLIATFTAPTGGTPAGAATVVIVVGYDQILK